MRNQIDTNDLKFALNKGFKPKGWLPCPRGKNGKINPQVTKIYLGGNQFMSVFTSKPMYYETVYGTWRPLREICEKHGNIHITIKYEHLDKVSPAYLQWLIHRQNRVGSLNITSPYSNELTYPVTDQLGLKDHALMSFSETTFYSAPEVATDTIDGAVGQRDASYDTCHDNTVGNAADSGSDYLGANVGIGTYRAGGTKYYIDRGFNLFDTNSIDTDDIDSATLEIAGYGNTLNYVIDTADDVYYVVTSTPNTDTTLIIGDFDQSGDSIDTPTRNSDAIRGNAISGGTAGTPVYQTFTLNATGEGNIDKTGITRLGLRHGMDEGTAPDTSVDNRWLPASANRTGGEPKLVVTHSAAGGATPPSRHIWW